MAIQCNPHVVQRHCARSLSLSLSSFFCEASLNWIHFMLGLSQFHGWVGQDLQRQRQFRKVRERERERESSGRIRAQRGLPYRTSTHLFGYFYPSPSVRKTYVLFVHKFEVFSSPFCADVIYRSPQRSVRRRRERVLIGESFVLSKREVNFLSFLPHSFETNKGIVFSGN